MRPRRAEVVFESRVSSPAARSRWGVTEPLSVHLRGDATAPLRRYTTAGETQSFAYVMFDDLVLAQEAELSLELEAEEIDYDPHYGIAETVTPPYYCDMAAARSRFRPFGPEPTRSASSIGAARW